MLSGGISITNILSASRIERGSETCWDRLGASMNEMVPTKISGLCAASSGVAALNLRLAPPEPFHTC